MESAADTITGWFTEEDKQSEIDEKKAMRIAKETCLRDSIKLDSRMDGLNKEYGFLKERYIEIASSSPRLLNITLDGAIDRQKELEKSFGISKTEFSRLIQSKKGVYVLLYGMEKIEDYYDFLHKSLGITRAEFARCIMSNASVFSYGLDTIKANQEHLITNFGKLIDPLADKITQLSILWMLVLQTERLGHTFHIREVEENEFMLMFI